nr:hypothetical protein [Tanacetum cinerariifolium]
MMNAEKSIGVLINSSESLAKILIRISRLSKNFDLDLSPLDKLDCDSLALGPFPGSTSFLVFLFFNPRFDLTKGASRYDSLLSILSIRIFFNSNSNTDAKSGSVDGGFVALVFGGGVDIDCCGGGVKDARDCGMMLENTCEELEITETGTVGV